MKVQRYSDFKLEEITPVNEGIFDTLRSIFTKLTSIFSDTEKLNKQVDIVSAKTEFATLKSQEIKPGATYIVKLQDPKDQNIRVLISMTKLAELPDKSGLFQISGTDNTKFLNTLKVRNVQELNKIGVLAIISDFELDKPLTMKVYKGVSQNGDPIITETQIKNVLLADDVIKEPTTT
jgi:hypothetical protein